MVVMLVLGVKGEDMVGGGHSSWFHSMKPLPSHYLSFVLILNKHSFKQNFGTGGHLQGIFPKLFICL